MRMWLKWLRNVHSCTHVCLRVGTQVFIGGSGTLSYLRMFLVFWCYLIYLIFLAVSFRCILGWFWVYLAWFCFYFRLFFSVLRFDVKCFSFSLETLQLTENMCQKRFLKGVWHRPRASPHLTKYKHNPSWMLRQPAAKTCKDNKTVWCQRSPQVSVSTITKFPLSRRQQKNGHGCSSPAVG